MTGVLLASHGLLVDTLLGWSGGWNRQIWPGYDRGSNGSGFWFSFDSFSLTLSHVYMFPLFFSFLFCFY